MQTNLNGTFKHSPLEQIPDVDAPHPSTFSKIRIDEMTDWLYSDDAQPVKGTRELSVKCCIAEEVIEDDLGYEISRTPFVRHRFYDEKQKKWSVDVASSRLNADGYMTIRTQDKVLPGLKARFGKALEAYQQRLASEGRALPIVLLADAVYPQVISSCECRGIMSINDLANAKKADLTKVEDHLRSIGQIRMADQIKTFQQRAKDRLDHLGITAQIAPQAA